MRIASQPIVRSVQGRHAVIHDSPIDSPAANQILYFASGAYTFDGTYSLTGSLFSPLTLYSNAAIDSGVTNPVNVIGDSVIVSFNYAHN